MLKVRLVTIGEDKDRWVTEGINHYAKLLSKYSTLEIVPLPSPKTSSSLSPDEIKRQEASILKEKLGKGMVIALADSGTGYDSRELAKQLERWQVSSGGVVTFVIGGPFGLDAQITGAASLVLSLSPLTYSHQLVRLVLLEQLYRSFTILYNTGYHK